MNRLVIKVELILKIYSIKSIGIIIYYFITPQVEMSEITNTFRLTIMGFMIVSGAINTIGIFLVNSAYKFQNTQYVYEGGYYKLFFHPYMQVKL